jgi:hypothetical protein
MRLVRPQHEPVPSLSHGLVERLQSDGEPVLPIIVSDDGIDDDPEQDSRRLIPMVSRAEFKALKGYVGHCLSDGGAMVVRTNDADG